MESDSSNDIHWVSLGVYVKARSLEIPFLPKRDQGLIIFDVGAFRECRSIS